MKETYTLFYREQDTDFAQKLYKTLTGTDADFCSMFDNDSTAGSYDQFTVVDTYEQDAYILVHNALVRGYLTHYHVY